MRIEDLAKKYIGIMENTSKHRKIIDDYNKIKPLPRKYKLKYSDSWCRGFVSMLANKCNCKKFPFECSVYYMTEKARKNKQITNKPKVGYLVIYDWKNNGSLDHVGVITRIHNNILTVVEGNYNNRVKVRYINSTSRDIECFIKVEYNTTENNRDYNEIAKKVLNGDYGNGTTRKTNLKNEGFNSDEIRKIQEIVNSLVNK